MKTICSKCVVGLALLGFMALRPAALSAESIDGALQARINAQVQQIQTWASDPVLRKTVQEHNSQIPADHAAMTQEKWQSLTILDPFVRSFSKNELGLFLKSKKTEVISEAFVSGATGLKVGFLAKTSNWSHKGKAKHEEPMAGRPWQGPIEVDESSGLQQIQVSLPVLDAGKPIGSLVVGLSLSKLRNP